MSSMHAFVRDSSDDSSDDNEDFLHPSTDPNAEEFADYNPRKRRRTGRDTKESAALGIFGSESEDEGPGKRWKGKHNLRGKGMAFVSTGQMREDDNENEEEEDDEMDDDGGKKNGRGGLGKSKDTHKKGRLGMGFGASRGIGSQNAPAPGNRSTPLGTGFVPSSANVPILKDTADDEISTPRISRPSAFSTPTSNNGRDRKKAPAGPPMNSFAAKMMAKMGYKEGDGLGKDGQGRSGVIEVQLRPQGVGLGAVREKSKQEKEEERRQAKIKGEVYEDSDTEHRKQKSRKSKGSEASSGISTPKRVKPKYRTVEELQKAAPGLNIPDAFIPILDMTGPGQRLLTSTSGILTPTIGIETMEQSENKKLASQAQNNLISFVEEWKNLQERKAYINMQLLQQQQEIEEIQPDHNKIKQFSETVQGLSQAMSNNQWDPILRALIIADSLQLSADNEVLSNIAVSAVHPFLRQFSDGWQPLEDPKMNGMAPSLFKIRHILGAEDPENGVSRIQIKSTTPYDSMIYKIIFPKIVSSINQSWNIHEPTPLLALLDVWKGLLPGFVYSQILDQAIVGKLNVAISSWNPNKRNSYELPHHWLFPWLQHLPSYHTDPASPTGLVSDIKRKFRQLIDSWDFKKGVIPGLQQWRELLHPNPNNDHWTPLIMNHILPSMSQFLKSKFDIEPQDQGPKLPALQGIFAWSSILKPHIVGQVIISTVFPMWHSVLHQWLTVTGPNEEIGKWFLWWRNDVFPSNIKSLKGIEEEFIKGEAMINRALDLGSRAATDLPIPSAHPPLAEKAKSPPVPIPPPRSIAEEVPLRHRVEDWCIENNLQFIPEKKVLHDVGPLYRITAAGNGKNGVLVYFKGETVSALQKGGAWAINWESEESKEVLLGMAHLGVK